MFYIKYVRYGFRFNISVLSWIQALAHVHPSSVDSARTRLRMPHSDGTASQTRASISRFRSFAAPTFPPVLEHRVHRVYSDTADSYVTPPNSHAPRFSQSASDHVLITRCLLFHWSIPATPLFLIGNMLPPARVLWILFLFFFLSVVFLRFWFTQLRLDPAVKKVVRLMCPGFASQLSSRCF